MDIDLYNNYAAVLQDLTSKRDAISSELKQIEAAIAAVSAAIASHSEGPLAKPLPFTPPITPPTPSIVPSDQKYSGMSVRWAVLNLMAEDTAEALRTSEIAEMLQAHGVRPGGQNFTSNVSAVVSDMTKKKGELTVEDGRYQITDHGRDVWVGIKRTPQYRYRLASSLNAH